MATFLDFEKPIAELEARVAELRDTASAGELNIEAEIGRLEEKTDRLLRETYARLTPWQKTQVARHPERPHFKDYVADLIEDFVPLGGDRNFGDDQAIIGGLGKLNGRKIVIIGHEKGDDTASRLRHNFGMARPEGYRKAIRLMELAGRFGLPVVTLVDTSGAFPGVEAEERAHRDPQLMADTLKDALLRHLNELQAKPLEQLMKAREQRLRGYGVYSVG